MFPARKDIQIFITLFTISLSLTNFLTNLLVHFSIPSLMPHHSLSLPHKRTLRVTHTQKVIHTKHTYRSFASRKMIAIKNLSLDSKKKHTRHQGTTRRWWVGRLPRRQLVVSETWDDLFRWIIERRRSAPISSHRRTTYPFLSARKSPWVFLTISCSTPPSLVKEDESGKKQIMAWKLDADFFTGRENVKPNRAIRHGSNGYIYTFHRLTEKKERIRKR